MNILNEISAGKIERKEAVRIIKTKYPNFDKTLLSKCLNAEKYGVTLVGQTGQTGTPVNRRGDRHRYKHKVVCHLPDEEYQQLITLIKSAGFDTAQQFLRHLIHSYIGGKHDTD